MRRRIALSALWLFAAGFVIIGVLISGNKQGFQLPKSIKLTEAKAVPLESKIQVLSVTHDGYGLTIIGKVVADKDYSYLQLAYATFDNQGNRVGSAFDNINNLKKGQTWKFSAYAYGSAKLYGQPSFSGW